MLEINAIIRSNVCIKSTFNNRLNINTNIIGAGPKGEKGDNGDKGEQGERGEQGARGLQGIPGQDGIGVPSGGNTGQVLAKQSNADHDTKWVNQSGGGSGSGIPIYEAILEREKEYPDNDYRELYYVIPEVEGNNFPEVFLVKFDTTTTNEKNEYYINNINLYGYAPSFKPSIGNLYLCNFLVNNNNIIVMSLDESWYDKILQIRDSEINIQSYDFNDDGPYSMHSFTDTETSIKGEFLYRFVRSGNVAQCFAELYLSNISATEGDIFINLELKINKMFSSLVNTIIRKIEDAGNYVNNMNMAVDGDSLFMEVIINRITSFSDSILIEFPVITYFASNKSNHEEISYERIPMSGPPV